MSTAVFGFLLTEHFGSSPLRFLAPASKGCGGTVDPNTKVDVIKRPFPLSLNRSRSHQNSFQLEDTRRRTHLATCEREASLWHVWVVAPQALPAALCCPLGTAVTSAWARRPGL